ncbi:DUF397 domain-containing protein [Streptomyces sp. NPDC048420]|uniref:DUF397 domain-containing protein n=1 Tax=Streptomyces sp. NPDC048420 TaxID=3155755 RepID=UPI00341BFE89
MNREDHIPTVLAGAAWRASSYSGGQGNCVEVADGFVAVLPVRDSKRPGGPLLVVSRDAWRTFLDQLR